MKKIMKSLRNQDLRRKICIVLGTRPAIIKMAPIIRELRKKGAPFFLLHTGQHYSHDMDQQFFEDLDLPNPKYRIQGVESCYFHGEQTAKMLAGAEKIFLKERPAIVIVGGDANTNLAGGLAARKLGITLGHVEAGLRSQDWRMPEEHNRVMLDHISDLLFAPTTVSRRNLIRDNVGGKIFVVGNTIADSVLQNQIVAEKRIGILKSLGVSKGKYVLVTAHREENVDDKRELVKLVTRLRDLVNLASIPIVFPMHPRTRRRISEYHLALSSELVLTGPLGYLDFLCTLQNTKMVVTDSGGIQEEASILRVPCVTIRKSTERPETMLGGANIVSGLNRKKFLESCEIQMNNSRKWQIPYKPGASTAIANVLLERL